MSTPGSTDTSALLRHSQYRSGFEQLLTSLSTRFINLPIDAIDDGIVLALAKIGTFTGVDRCFVYQFVDDSQKIGRMTHEWCAPGIPSIKHRVQDLDVEPLQWVVEQLAVGQIIHVPDSRQLPDEAAALRDLYDSLGVRSAVYLPLFFKPQATGMLGFSCVTHKKVWSEDSINLLRVVGEIVVNAFDRKSDYLQLQLSQEQYKSVVEDQSDFIVRWKPDGTHTFVNGAMCRFLEKTPDELIGSNLFDILHPDDVDDVRRKVASLTIDQPSTTDEHRVRRADGTVAWHEWSDRAIFDSSGNVVEFQSVGRDVTAQKDAREELAYRQRLEQIILNITSRFINLPPEQFKREIIGALRQVGEFVRGDRSYIYLFDSSGTSATLEFEWITTGAPATPVELQTVAVLEQDWGMQLLKQGDPMPISDIEALPPSAQPLQEALSSINVASFILVPILLRKQLIGFMGISSSQPRVRWSPDSTALLRLIGEVFANALERKAAEEALAASEERLRVTIDAVADGFYDWDMTTNRVFVSDNWLACRQLPEGENQWDVDTWRASIHPDDQRDFADGVAEHLSGKTCTFECEYRVQLADGTWRWILDRGRVIERDERGTALRMVGAERDITEQVVSRRRLQEADAHLAHLARVATMGEIVAGIAHEVNQPLHAAATFANAVTTALESNDKGSRRRAMRMMGKISAQINRAADIIRRLREFTRPRQVHMARCDINNLVRETAEMLSYEAKRKRIRMEFDLDEFLPGVIGDRIQLQQVIVNLLRNAFEAIEPNVNRQPLITVRTRREENRVLLEVSDNGVGLAAGKDAEQLFDAFITTKEEGMGMGLALCRTIVTGHHGRIGGKCNERAGMTFSVLLPVEPEKRHE
jgi:PAS domain S-box-containing protein